MAVLPLKGQPAGKAVDIVLHISAALALSALFAGLIGANFKKNSATPRGAVLTTAVYVTAMVAYITYGVINWNSVSERTKPVFGAHYYSWFPENWKAGHAGDVAQPKYEPLLGRYLSDDPSVFGAHIEWAKEAGIRFFVFDWWPERRSARRRIRKNLDHAANLLNNFEFAVQYETLDLKTSERKPRPDEDFNELIMTQERAERMAKHWQHIATEYASHPAYKRIDGRPVLFVYASRHVVGDASKYFLWAKEEVARVTGVSFYLIGDEVYFNVLDRTRKGEVILKSERTANWPRLSAFDAITCYNPYDSSRKEHSGREGLERFIADVSDLYRYYRGVAAAGGQRFFPGIIPGYDDRGVRPKAGHYIIPRQDSTGRSLLSRLFDEWSGAHLTPENDQILITSWNEWNEGTQIEPSRDALGQSPADAPGSCGQLVEQSSYGCKYLSELRRISRKYR